MDFDADPPANIRVAAVTSSAAAPLAQQAASSGQHPTLRGKVLTRSGRETDYTLRGVAYGEAPKGKGFGGGSGRKSCVACSLLAKQWSGHRLAHVPIHGNHRVSCLFCAKCASQDRIVRFKSDCSAHN